MLMKTSRILLAILTPVFAFALSAQADIFFFDLLGKAGPGLLPGNENGTINGTAGSGGELGNGIFFDDVTNLLSIEIGWGSANGFTDLTGDTSAGHIHGPTASAGTASFLENAPVWIPLNNLAEWDESATSGGFDGAVTLTDEQEIALFQGRLYINAHTQLNPGGEIRGNIVVPEPTTISLVALAAGVGYLLLRRRRA
jgi:hypothetical protein